VVLVSVVALVVAGCGGAGGAPQARQAASPPTGCAARPDASSGANLLWLGGRPNVVYYVRGKRIISSQGHGRALPPFAIPVGFRACRTPLLLYDLGPELRATALTGGPKTLTLGRDSVVAPDGRLVSYVGSRIRYAGGSSFVARGLPLTWKIADLAVSPRDPQVFVAAAQSPEAGIETCGKGLGGIYRVTPSGSKTLFVDNPCRDHPEAGWSPDGSTISYIAGPAKNIYVLDASGSHPRRLTAEGDVRSYLWSPDGTQIAYVTKQGDAAVVAVSGGAVHELGRGAPLAWSPDGREIAFAVAGRPLIEAVSATGASPRVLLRLRKS
jgi:hypothetical protein